jgi:hypothetical protein
MILCIPCRPVSSPLGSRFGGEKWHTPVPSFGQSILPCCQPSFKLFFMDIQKTCPECRVLVLGMLEGFRLGSVKFEYVTAERISDLYIFGVVSLKSSCQHLPLIISTTHPMIALYATATECQNLFKAHGSPTQHQFRSQPEETTLGMRGTKDVPSSAW